MLEWINPWITGGLSITCFIAVVVLIVFEVKKGREPVTTLHATTSDGEKLILNYRGAHVIEVIRIDSDK